MTDRITLCAGCRPDDAQALAANLQSALTAAGLGTEVALTDCMNICSNPVSVAVRANGKAAYLFAGVDPVSQLADLTAFARLYAAADSGIIDDARPCGDLRFKLVGRLPA